MSKVKTPTVQQILLHEEVQSERTTKWHEIILSIFFLYVLVTLLNIYFLYKGLFFYFGMVTDQYKNTGVTLPFSVWKVVLVLEYPILKYTFNNSNTALIIRDLISAGSCLNPTQCKQCCPTCSVPQDGDGTTITCALCQDASGRATNCYLIPYMLFGPPSPMTQTFNNQNWTDPNNYFYPFIQPDAPIIPGNKSDSLSATEQSKAISALFSGGFVALVENEFTTWTSPELFSNVFGNDNKPATPCTNNYGAFVSGVGSSIFAGMMAGGVGGPPGAIIGGIAGAILGGVSSYKNISC